MAAGLASGKFNDHSIIDTNPGYIKVGAKLLEDEHRPRRDRPRDDPRQELERRHGASSRCRSSPSRCASTLDRARLRPGDHERLSRRVRGPAASLLALAAGRHRVDVARLRPVGHAAAARACVRDGRRVRRRAARSRSCASRRRPPASARSIRRVAAHADPPARSRGRARGRRQAGARSRLSRRRQDRHRVEGDRAAATSTDRYLAVFGGVAPATQSAARGRRGDRRARARASTTAAKSPRRCSPASWAARCACWRCRPTRRSATRRAGPRMHAPGGHAMNAATDCTRTASPSCSRASPTLPRDVAVTDLTLDSRAARPGGAVPRVRGSVESRPRVRAAGRRAWRARGAVGAGAGAPVVPDLPFGDLRRAACRTCASTSSTIADRFFGAPSRALAVAGITGTNGKTTCAYLLAQALELLRPAGGLHRHARLRPARTRSQPSAHTTADAVSVQRAARELARRRRAHASRWKCPRTRSTRRASTACASTPRCSPTSRATTSTTTARWTATARPRRGCSPAPTLAARVINVDDAFGRQLASTRAAAAALIVTSRGHQSRARSAAAFVRATHVTLVDARHRARVRVELGHRRADVPADRRLQRRQPAHRARRAARLGRAARADAAHALAQCAPRQRPHGNFRRRARAPLAVVDYAHTPDALRKALSRGARALPRPAASSCSAAAAIATPASAR